jgi:uncharacterized protein (DUF1800 family)
MALSRAEFQPRRRGLVMALGMGAVWAGTTHLPSARASPTDPALTAQAAAWRVLSRVGYGPSTPSTQQVRDLASARDWALQQVDLAYAASQQPPQLPPELSGFDAPLPALFEGARREREAIRQPDASGTDGNTGKSAASMAPRPPFLADLGPRYFNRAMLQQSAAWRLYSATRPDIENPLLARLTEFWFNHLNVFAYKGPVRPFVGHYAIHVARAHALGKFEDLLLASARHPAMLFYLDQFQSVAEGTRGRDGRTRGLNENYARELMELHSLGGGGYTQADVRDLARILTGWTVSPRDADGFQFLPRGHDGGAKRLLGQDFPRDRLAVGEREGVDAIRMLARHPATARRIGMRLAQCFVADDPAPDLVQQLASIFLTSQGDLHQVMRALLQSPDFWAPGNRLFKTPMDFALSGLIAVQDGDSAQAPLDRRRMAMTLAFLNDAGQPLHSWQTPDGYRFDTATWMVPEALTRRADFALALGRESPEPHFLQPYLSSATRARIDQSPPALRTGLMLASPDFMFK